MTINWKVVLFVALIVYGAIKHFNQGIAQRDYLLPSQLQSHSGVYYINGYQVKTLEPFKLHGRILSSKRYSSDKSADLSPVDLAMGWGPMADMAISSQIEISQSNRWYHWHAKQLPIPKREIETHSANMHLIPATPAIEESIKAAKTGQMVTFYGDLVEVTNPQGFYWKSSLSREDTGAGACELVLVKSFKLL